MEDKRIITDEQSEEVMVGNTAYTLCVKSVENLNLNQKSQKMVVSVMIVSTLKK